MQPLIPTPNPDSCDRRIMRAIFTINPRAQSRDLARASITAAAHPMCALITEAEAWDLLKRYAPEVI
jgi:hypothetical protein